MMISRKMKLRVLTLNVQNKGLLNFKQKVQSRVKGNLKKSSRDIEYNQDGFRRYLTESLEMQRQKLKLEELRVRLRVAIKGGITDEDRAHQLKRYCRRSNQDMS